MKVSDLYFCIDEKVMYIDGVIFTKTILCLEKMSHIIRNALSHIDSIRIFV